MIIIIMILIIIIIIIINKQITNILANTEDSGNHCKKYKYKMYIKNLKKYKIYIIFVFFRHIAER